MHTLYVSLMEGGAEDHCPKDGHQKRAMNVYEMYLANRGAGFWIRRNSWGHTCARVTSVGEMSGPHPFYGTPCVHGDVYDLATGELKEERAQISCPGTYSYHWIEPPPWVSSVDLPTLADRGPSNDVLRREAAREKARQRKTSAEAAERERIGTSPKVLLSVPYARKDEAKSLGAKWDPTERVWWLPADDGGRLRRAAELGFLPD
jgi:hypothetical protein